MNKRILGIFLFLLVLGSNFTFVLTDYVNAYEESDVIEIQATDTVSPELNATIALDENTTYPCGLESFANYTQSILDDGWPVVLFFHADWCYFCQAMKPNVDIAEEIYKENIVFLRINEANNSALLVSYNITAFPALIILKPDNDENTIISGYKEISELIKELNQALGETEKTPASSICSEFYGGLFNHYSCSFTDCMDECLDQKEIDWKSIGVEALEAAWGCLTPFGVPYSCSKASITQDFGDTTSCLSNGLDMLEKVADVGGPVSPSCIYDLSHLLADMLGAEQLGQCLGQCTADPSSYGQVCQPGEDRMYCVDGQTISMEQCNEDCEYGFKPNAPVGTCYPGNCEMGANGAECKDEDESDDPDDPPKRPPRMPAGDHPDDNFDLSTSWLESQYTWLGDTSSIGQVAILSRGYPLINHGLVEYYTSLYGEAPELIDVSYIKYINPLENPLLILPTGSLYGLSGVPSVRESLENYAERGGTIIAFAQYSGSEFELLPGGEVKGYGWDEDTSCTYGSVIITDYHPIFSGIPIQQYSERGLPVGSDGFFLTIPEDSKVLLTRIKNYAPAMIEYSYGAGKIIATTLYNDMAPLGNIYQGGAFYSKLIIKNMLEFGKSDKPIPTVKPDLSFPVMVEVNFTNPLIMSGEWTEYARGDLIQKTIEITNHNITDIDKITFTILDPYYQKYQVNISQAIASGQAENITLDFQTPDDSPAGIWIILYDLYQGNAWRGNGYGGAFSLDVDLTKLTSFTMLYNITDPDGAHVENGSYSFDLDPSNSITIGVPFSAETEGLWKIQYRIETIEGLVVKKGNQVIDVTVTNPLSNGFTFEPTIRLSVTSDHEHYPGWYTGEFTTHIWNNDIEEKEVLLAINFPHHLSRTHNEEIYGSPDRMHSLVNYTLTVPANGYSSYTYTVPILGLDTCIVSVLENHGTSENPVYSRLGTASRTFYVHNARGAVNFGIYDIKDGQVVLPVIIVGQNLEGVNRFTYELRDWMGNTKYYTEFEKLMQPNERYTQNITIPLDETWVDNTYYYTAKTYWITDDWNFYWNYRYGKLTIPEVDVDIPLNNYYKVGDTAYLNVTYTNPVNVPWTQDTTLVINDIGFVHSETINLKPIESYTSHITIQIPEDTEKGSHRVTLYLQQDNRKIERNLVIPWSSLVTSLPTELTKSVASSINITNHGGVHTDCEYIFTIHDLYGNEIIHQTNTSTIKAGKTLELEYTLPPQLVETKYVVSVTTKNLENNRVETNRATYRLNGLSANLLLETSKPVYQTGNQIDFTVNSQNNDGPIIDGEFLLKISSTEPQGPLTCVIPEDDLVITQDTILCPGVYQIVDEGSQGIIIFSGDDIVLDGNGATIDGIDAGSYTSSMGYGVRNGFNSNNTIKNLNIENYQYAVSIAGGSNNIVSNVNITSGTRGVNVGGTDNLIFENVFVDCYRGVYGTGDRNIIQGNTFNSGNIGIYSYNEEDIIVYNNTFYDNTYGFQYIGSGWMTPPGNVTIKDNIFIENSNAIDFEHSLPISNEYGSIGNIITGNILQNNPRGIWLQYCDNSTITNNVIEDSSIFAIQVYTGSDNNIIANNNISRSKTGVYLYYYWGVLTQEGPPANHDNKIINNNILNSTNEGIFLERDVNRTLIANNKVLGSGYYGIELKGVVTNSTIVNNTFTRGNRASYLVQTYSVGPTGNLFYRNVDKDNDYNSYGLFGFINYWNSSGEGNYWGNYGGDDSNSDGIGDTPYTSSAIVDYYPYMEPYTWSTYDLGEVVSDIKTPKWSTLGPYNIPDVDSGSQGSGEVTIWERSTPFNMDSSYTETIQSLTVNEDGKYYITGTLESSTGQIITYNKTIFYVIDQDTYLSLETDKSSYKPDETVEINATIINTGQTTSNGVLLLSINGTGIYSNPYSVAPSGKETTLVYTSTNKTMELTGEIQGFTIKETIPIYTPIVTTNLITPEIATHHPQIITLGLINDGKIEANLNVEMLDINTSLTLKPSEIKILNTTISIIHPIYINATITGDKTEFIQKLLPFGENVTASLYTQDSYLEGIVPITYLLENNGTVDSYMDIQFKIENQEISQTIILPAMSNITGRQTFNLTSGLYNLSLTTPFETIYSILDVQSPPIFEIIDYPETLNYTIGELVILPFTVKNTGTAGGTAHITLKSEGITEDTQSIMLEPEQENTSNFTLSLPDDLPSSNLTVTLHLNEEEYQTTIQLSGIDVNVSASLDKKLYTYNETTILKINVTNLNDMDLNLVCSVGLGNYSEDTNFTLIGGGDMLLTYYIPVSFDEKLTYAIYVESGRALYINRLYLYEKPETSEGILLYTDKQVYNMLEPVKIYVNTTTSGVLSITAPQYNLIESLESGSMSYTYNLPKLRTGTYYLSYNYNNYSNIYPIDVNGYTATPINVSINKAEYINGDNLSITLNVLTNYDFSGLVKLWLYDAGGDIIGEESLNNTFVTGENIVKISTILDTQESGIHGYAFRIYAYGSIIWLNSGGGYFDVSDTTPPDIQITSPQSQTYTTTTIPLTYTINEPTQWVKYSLDGQANVTLTGNTTLAALTKTTHTLTIYANDSADNTGSATVTFTVTSSSGGGSTGPTTPSYPTLSPVLLNPATNVTMDSLKLSWSISDSSYFDEYRVYQSTLEGELGTEIVRISEKTETQYMVEELTMNTVYYFTVRVIDTYTQRADSNQITAETLGDNTPPQITILSPVNTTAPPVYNLDWSTAENLSYIFVSIDGGENNTLTPGYLFTGLAPGLHTVVLYASDLYGNLYEQLFTLNVEASAGTPPEIVHFPVKNALGSEPLSIYAVARDDNDVEQVSLYWREHGETMFNSASMVMCDGCVDAYSFEIDISEASDNIEYYILASNGVTQTTVPADAPSEVYTVTVNQVPGVVLVSLDEVSSDSVKISWVPTSIDDFENYTIYLSEDPSSLGDPVTSISEINTGEYTVEGLIADSTYYLTLRVYDTAGQYADSGLEATTAAKQGLSPILIGGIVVLALACILYYLDRTKVIDLNSLLKQVPRT